MSIHTRDKYAENDLSASVANQVEFERICEDIRSIDEIVEDILPLQNSITLLNLHGNKFTNINNFPRLPCLKSLILSSNHIISCDMNELPCFSSLTSLDLSSNRIAKIDDLPFLPGLENLILSFNFIESLTAINENCPNIQRLDIRGNRLKTPVAFIPLQGCRSLTSILLSSKESPNPICEDASKIPFFPKLFELIPNLCTLDSKSETEWGKIIANANSLMVETPKFDKLLEKMKSRWTDEWKDEENNSVISNKGNSDSSNSIRPQGRVPQHSSLRINTNEQPKDSLCDSHPQVNNKLYLTIAAPDSSISMSNKLSSDHDVRLDKSSNGSQDVDDIDSMKRGASNNVHIQIQPLGTSHDRLFPLAGRGGTVDVGVQCTISNTEVNSHRQTVSACNSPIVNLGDLNKASFAESFPTSQDSALEKRNVIKDVLDNSNSDLFSREKSLFVHPEVVDMGVKTDDVLTESCGINTSNDNITNLCPLAKILIRNMVRITEQSNLRLSLYKWSHCTIVANLNRENSKVNERLRREFSNKIEELVDEHRVNVLNMRGHHRERELGMQETIDSLKASTDSLTNQCSQLSNELNTTNSKYSERTAALEATIASKDTEIANLHSRIIELESSLKTTERSVDDRVESEVRSAKEEAYNAAYQQLREDKAKAFLEKDAQIEALQSKYSKRIQLLKNVVDELKRSNEEHVKKGEVLSSRISEFVTVMSEMKALIKQLKSDLSKSNNRNIELSTLLESEKSHYGDQKSDMESQIRILEAKLSERQQELIDCKQKFEAQLSSYDLNNRASNSSNKKLQSNVSDMYKRLETAEKEMMSLISDLTAIRKADQDKAIALKVKDKMLTDSQNSANSYKLKLSILESENLTLNERIASLEDSYHRLKEDRDFIEDQLQAKSGAEQDLVDLLAKIENSKTSINKLTAGNRRGRGVVNKREDGKPATVFDSNVSESFNSNSNYYGHDDIEDEDDDGVEDEDELDELKRFGAEFDSRSGKVVFNKQPARDSRRGGGGSVVDEEGVQSNSIDEEHVIHRLFNKSVVCNKRKCRTHLNYLENELKLKDDIIAELKLVK